MIPSFLWAMALLSLLVAAFYLLHLLLFSPENGGAGPSVGEEPLVSLLKPLKHADGPIEACVESFFRLEYKRFELIFAVDREGDDAQRMVERLMLRYPLVACRILATGHTDRINPKIHKLAAMERISRGQLLWVSDANVQVEPTTLNRLVNEMATMKVKLLFSPIRGRGSRSFGSLVENSYINSFLSGNVIAAWKILTHPIIVGKSILLERAALRQFGGFAFFRHFMAEDYIMGDAYRRSALPVGLSSTWIDNVNTRTTLAGCRERLLRWAQLRFHLRPAVYLLEPAANPLFYALAALIAGGFEHLSWFLAVLLLKILFELWGAFRLDAWGESPMRQVFMFPAAVVMKDLLMIWVFIAPFFKRSVRWSGEAVRIGPQTRIGDWEWGLTDGA